MARYPRRHTVVLPDPAGPDSSTHRLAPLGGTKSAMALWCPGTLRSGSAPPWRSGLTDSVVADNGRVFDTPDVRALPARSGGVVVDDDRMGSEQSERDGQDLVAADGNAP